MVVKLNFMLRCSVLWCVSGSWLYMDPVHLYLKKQYTLKVEPLFTTGPSEDQTVQLPSPESRNDPYMLNQHSIIFLL